MLAAPAPSPLIRKLPVVLLVPPVRLTEVSSWKSDDAIRWITGSWVKVAAFRFSNWSGETFPSQRERFPFLEWFDGIVLSGQEGCMKPDERIFRILLDRYALAAHDTVFIDDNPNNARAASALGIHGIHFKSPEELRRELSALGLL